MWRVLSIKPFPVQIIGGIILHQGRIAEMKTGEGKTFTAALPAYLNALSGKGVHIVTVNDYLAKYQGEMMARVFNYLGLTVGLAIPGMEPDEKKKAYACDITYATNNEIGFDYLRDNMVTYKERKVQRGHNFAIVDEVAYPAHHFRPGRAVHGALQRRRPLCQNAAPHPRGGDERKGRQ